MTLYTLQVCAHRYMAVTSNSDRFLVGKCFYTQGTILEEFQEFQPCSPRSSKHSVKDYQILVAALHTIYFTQL